MDKGSIQHIIDTSDKLRLLNNQKLRAKEKFESNITIGYDSGLFTIDTSLLTYTSYLLQNGKTTNTVILDSNQDPILIKDVKQFNDKIQDVYFSAIDTYRNDVNDLKRLKASTARYLDLES
jgi:activator of 2-hydroxyglutaryl-CoA dehydratase